MTTQSAIDGTKQRVENLFKVQAELHNVRRRPSMKVDSHPWVLSLGELPSHSAVRLRRIENIEGEEDHSFHLEVKRASVETCPAPPEEIEHRLEPGWDDPLGKVAVKQYRRRPDDEVEDEDDKYEELPHLTSEQEQELRWWSARRDRWVQRNREAARLNGIFQRFYGLWSVLQREAESYELLLADGALTALTEKGSRSAIPSCSRGSS